MTAIAEATINTDFCESFICYLLCEKLRMFGLVLRPVRVKKARLYSCANVMPYARGGLLRGDRALRGASRDRGSAPIGKIYNLAGNIYPISSTCESRRTRRFPRFAPRHAMPTLFNGGDRFCFSPRPSHCRTSFALCHPPVFLIP